MDLLHRCCAGLDIHKETVVACVRKAADGGKVRQEVRTFRTETSRLLELADWLTDEGVTHVAMESTGVYWKPVWNLFEDVFELLLVNAEHIKAVPGRKTDVKDSQWIAELLQHGLLRPSFVPEKPVRQLRDLTRQRTQLVRQKVQVANRIQKTLEDANVKLGSVASDVLGASGRDMLRAIIKGERDPIRLADLARQQLRKKIPQLQEALMGEIEDHHRFLLGMLMEQVDFLEAQIGKLAARIGQVLPRPFEEAIDRLDTIPGIDRKAAEVIVAEMGADLEPFASSGHLASWVGAVPRQPRKRGQAQERQDDEGEQVAARDAGAVRVGGVEEQGDVPEGDVRSAGGAAGEEEGAGGGGAPAGGDHLQRAEEGAGVQGGGGGLPGEGRGQGSPGGTPAAPAGEVGGQGNRRGGAARRVKAAGSASPANCFLLFILRRMIFRVGRGGGDRSGQGDQERGTRGTRGDQGA